MTQEELIKVEVPVEKFDLLTREELIQFARLEQQFRLKLQKEVNRLRAFNEELKQKVFFIEDRYIVIKNKFFGKSSERSLKKTEENGSDGSGDHKSKKTKVQLPSERYPDAPLIERDVILQQLPSCKSCGEQMRDSGMTEDSEYLTVIPQQYFVIRQKRHKYRCSKCHGDIATAPNPPRVKEGSAYTEIIESPILHADETPHRMLEGDEKQSWYLWGFSTPKTSFFECHDTRSGDVVGELLSQSKCTHLISDVFSGYAKAVREANEIRETEKLPKIANVYCNAHARRKFNEAKDSFPDEAEFFIDHYRKIYHLESQAGGQPANPVAELRNQMAPLYSAMKAKAMENLGAYSSKSSIGKAMGYFLRNFNELTLFLKKGDLPIDNNPQERLLRNPVIGRKTWYGTHSKRGAQTAAILFSLVESCKLNKINPRAYFKNLIQDLHHKKSPYTPAEFKNLHAG